MSKKSRAVGMIKFGYVMLAVYMTIAFVFWVLEHTSNNLEVREDHHVHALMFMIGSSLWVIMLLVWYKVLGQAHEEEK